MNNQQADYAIREFHTFRIELRDTIDTALNRLSILEESAANWVSVDLALTRESDDPRFGNQQITAKEIEAMNAQWSTQTALFAALEDFLARWARISNILYPTSKQSGTIQRGKRLRERLGLPESYQKHILGDRSLRDAWAHFDERLDACLANNRLAHPQWFDQSRSITPYLQEKVPRLFVLDTLELYYHDRTGNVCRSSLHMMKEALTTLRQSLWQSTTRE
jgi:hypothetical protein